MFLSANFLSACRSLSDGMHALLVISPMCFVQVFYEAPLPKNTTLGSSAKFSCNVSGSSTVFWYVNGTFYKDQAVLARGISSEHEYDDLSDSSKTILTIDCDEQNNNTLIQCSGIHGDQLIESSVVVLRIQGIYM